MLRPDDRRVGFGVTLLPNALPEFLSWCRTAEESGFDTIGIGDSQSLYREAFLAAALCAQETKHVKFGPRVINPMTRHPAISASGAATLQEIAPGRAVLAANLIWRVPLPHLRRTPCDAPSTRGRHASKTDFRAKAFKMISGPIPTGSPMVMPMAGRSIPI